MEILINDRWKMAILAHIQNRMWIKLGSSPASSALPPRFDRHYHPNELSHFDKYFAKSWTTPSRLSHEDRIIDTEVDISGLTQRKTAPKEPKASLFDERVQSSKVKENKISIDEENEEQQSLKDYILVNGFNSKNRTSLNQLLRSVRQSHHSAAELSDRYGKS
jgi:hypothetical protein